MKPAADISKGNAPAALLIIRQHGAVRGNAVSAIATKAVPTAQNSPARMNAGNSTTRYHVLSVLYSGLTGTNQFYTSGKTVMNHTQSLWQRKAGCL